MTPDVATAGRARLVEAEQALTAAAEVERVASERERAAGPDELLAMLAESAAASLAVAAAHDALAGVWREIAWGGRDEDDVAWLLRRAAFSARDDEVASACRWRGHAAALTGRRDRLAGQGATS